MRPARPAQDLRLTIRCSDNDESDIGASFLEAARERFERMHDTSSQSDLTERLAHIRDKSARRQTRLETVRQERSKIMRQLKDEERSWAQGRQRASVRRPRSGHRTAQRPR